MEMKKCSKCGKELPLTSEYYDRDITRISGFRNKCKVCRKADGKKYYGENADKISQKYNENSECYRQRYRDYYEKNKSKEYDRKRQWQIKNPDKCVIQTQRRKAVRSKLLSELTNEQWEHVKSHFDNRCAYCGKELPLAQEHFIPLSKGGEYTINNIIPSCQSCNSSKSNKDFFQWYPRYRHYSKKRQKAILEFLNYKNNEQQLKII